jgi:hypothetical protein
LTVRRRGVKIGPGIEAKKERKRIEIIYSRRPEAKKTIIDGVVAKT